MQILKAASWDIAARVARAAPAGTRIYETHPGGGM